MIKLTDAYDFVKKKIARNSILIEIYKLRGELSEYEILLKKEHHLFYKIQQSKMLEINEIELKQSREYTKEREMQVIDLINEIGIFKPNADTKILIKKVKNTKAEIASKIDTVNYIQTQIPKSGTVTNYTVVISNSTQTCASAMHGLK
jgi:hypothetical protein